MDTMEQQILFIRILGYLLVISVVISLITYFTFYIRKRNRLRKRTFNSLLEQYLNSTIKTCGELIHAIETHRAYTIARDQIKMERHLFYLKEHLVDIAREHAEIVQRQQDKQTSEVLGFPDDWDGDPNGRGKPQKPDYS